jgi:membrane associated rhomboid family serine protease
MSSPTVVHQTRDFQRYTLARDKYRELTRAVRWRPYLKNWLGAAMPLVLVLGAMIAQLNASPFGSNLPDDIAAQVGLSPATLAETWRHLLRCLIFHSSPYHMFFNLAVLLLFGIPLGWRHGLWKIAYPFLGGGLAGALVGLATNGPPFVGMDGAVMGVMCAALLVAPRFHEREGRIPWNLLLGYGTVVTLACLAPEHLYAGYFSGAGAGMISFVFVAEARFRDYYRLASFFLLIALLIVHRLAVIFTTDFSWMYLPRLAGGLFVVVICTIYVMSQAELTRDQRRWDREKELDKLVRQEGESISWRP